MVPNIISIFKKNYFPDNIFLEIKLKLSMLKLLYIQQNLQFQLFIHDTMQEKRAEITNSFKDKASLKYQTIFYLSEIKENKSRKELCNEKSLNHGSSMGNLEVMRISIFTSKTLSVQARFFQILVTEIKLFPFNLSFNIYRSLSQ